MSRQTHLQEIVVRERMVLERRLAELALDDVGASQSSRIRILVAARDEELLLLIDRAMVADGRFQVVSEARDGAEAVALAIADQPDAVVLDSDLALLSGLEAAQEIMRYAPDAKILLLAADPEIEADARWAGVHAVRARSGPGLWMADVLAKLVD
jgi:chemotaxis response regulator CheB